MTANEMRAALRLYCARSRVVINGLDAMDASTLQPVYKALIGGPHATSNALSDPRFVVNNTDLAALAQRVKSSIDTVLTANDLAQLPIARLQELDCQLNLTGYNLNGVLNGADGEDEGELLRAVTALKNAMQSAGQGALATLGLATLEDLRMEVEKAVAATSASMARNADQRHTAGLAPAGAEEFAGYDLNAF